MQASTGCRWRVFWQTASSGGVLAESASSTRRSLRLSARLGVAEQGGVPVASAVVVVASAVVAVAAAATAAALIAARRRVTPAAASVLAWAPEARQPRRFFRVRVLGAASRSHRRRHSWRSRSRGRRSRSSSRRRRTSAARMQRQPVAAPRNHRSRRCHRCLQRLRVRLPARVRLSLLPLQLRHRHNSRRRSDRRQWSSSKRRRCRPRRNDSSSRRRRRCHRLRLHGFSVGQGPAASMRRGEWAALQPLQRLWLLPNSGTS